MALMTSWLSLALCTSIVIVPITYAFVFILNSFRLYRRRIKLIKQLPVFPGTHWLFGSLLDLPGTNEEGLQWMKNKANQAKGSLVTVWFGPFNPAISLYHPNSVKAILKTSEPKPRGIGGYFMLVPWLGDGLLLAGGSKWARNRRLLTPAFHFDILRPYMDVNNRCADIFLQKLQQFSDKGEYFEAMNHVSLLTLDVILRCAFSYENDCQLQGETHPYVNAVNSLARAITHRLLHPYLYPDLIFKLSSHGRECKRNCDLVHAVSDEVIQKRKEALRLEGEKTLATKGRYLDFLDVLLTARDEHGQGLSDLEIRDEVDTFLFEGHDTTASGIAWTLYSLAAHPEHQQRCQQEVDEILAHKENKDIEWDDLPKLKYVTMCLKESLRMHTPVPFIERQTTQDMTLEGFTLPAGSLIDIHLYILHHNSTVWDNPEEYRPDRFSEENSKNASHFAFVPFSAGPRNCIGQHFALHEMKTVIAKVLSRFTLSLHPERQVKHRIVVVMKTEDGMYLKATPRHHANRSDATQ